MDDPFYKNPEETLRVFLNGGEEVVMKIGLEGFCCQTFYVPMDCVKNASPERYARMATLEELKKFDMGLLKKSRDIGISSYDLVVALVETRDRLGKRV